MISNREIRREAHTCFREHRLLICGMLAVMELILAGVSAVFAVAIDVLLLSFSARLRLLTTSLALLEHLPLIVLALYLLLLVLLGWLFGGMQTGLCSALTRLVRGEEVSFSVLFSRMRLGFRGFLLLLLVGLKVMLWTLPASIIWGELTILQRSFQLSDAVMLGGNLVCGAVMLALVLPCLLRHALCFHIIADHPETGLRTAIGRSKYLLRYWKFQFFRLCIPYFLVYSVAMAAIYAAARYGLQQTAGDDMRLYLIALPTLLTFLVSLLYSGHLFTAQTVFYERSLPD